MFLGVRTVLDSGRFSLSDGNFSPSFWGSFGFGRAVTADLDLTKAGRGVTFAFGISESSFAFVSFLIGLLGPTTQKPHEAPAVRSSFVRSFLVGFGSGSAGGVGGAPVSASGAAAGGGSSIKFGD
jgi:hypothetical protein